MNISDVMKRMEEMSNQVDEVYARIARHYGLTYNTLMMMYMTDESSRLTQKQVCDALYLPKSSVHTMLVRLIRLGYLDLAPGGNRKEKYIVFTETGRVLMDKIQIETEKIENSSLSSVSPRELESFMRTASKLAAAMFDTVQRVYGEGGHLK